MVRLAFLSGLFYCSMGYAHAFQWASAKGGAFSRRELTQWATNGQVEGHFTSHPMKVFIEDTDTYGVVYNANYLKFYDRALFMARPSSLPGGVMVSVGNQKFRSSPGLGDEFVVEGTLTAIDNAQREVWDLSMKSLDGNTVYHSADDLVLAVPNSENWLIELSKDALDSGDSEARSDAFPAYRDEFDPSMASHIPLTSVLKHMERPRTNVLGGPMELRKLMDDYGILVVVSGIKDLCLLEHDTKVLIGDNLTIKTSSRVFKGGMRTDMYQTLYTSNGQRLAQGVVTLLTLNRKTLRPTSKLPDRILGLIEGGDSP